MVKDLHRNKELGSGVDGLNGVGELAYERVESGMLTRTEEL